MAHTAYDLFHLIEDTSLRIDAIESYGSILLLSVSDGSLRIYGPGSSAGSVSPTIDLYSEESHLTKEPYVLQRAINRFSRKPMLAMEVIKSRDLLLSLSESIAFHKLPNFETLAVITKAKGANAFSWDEKRGLLCFARQKRVCIFRHDGGRGLVEVKEFGVPDTVKSMSWCGENICLGIRREYLILNTSNGALSEIFPSGRTAPPLVLSLPSGQLLLGKDNIGVFVDQNGKLLQDGRICWSEAPVAVVIDKLYAVGLLPKHVEIRSLRDPYPLVQTVALRNARHILQNNYAVIVSLEKSISGLFSVPLGAQIIQLTASGNFEEALSLCKLLPPEDLNLRAAKELSIHVRYAHHLFENQNYEDSMEHFLASQVEISYVLSLYPSIVLPKSSVIPEPEIFKDVTGDTTNISSGSSAMSDDLESTLPPTFDSEEYADHESRKMNHNSLMALTKFLQKKRYSTIEKAAAEGTEEVVSDIFVSYGSSRLKKFSKGRANAPISSVARDTAAILDSALLQALLLTGQSSAALDLLKSLNYCDVKICEEFLKEKNQNSCLIELYRWNGMHREALNLLHKLVEMIISSNPHDELAQTFKPQMIIDYLKPLCGTDPMLVLEFSMLVLEKCPNETIDIFLSGNIPADIVNSYLKQHAPKMQTTYLELMISMNENSVSGNLQNEMVQLYLSEVLDWYTDLRSKQQWDDKTYSPTRKKLLSALESVAMYNPEILLNNVPRDALFEERAILLGRMNQHELALSIYIHKLHVPEMALAYCDRVYESSHQQSAKSASSIYLILLQIYLNPQKNIKNLENRITNITSNRSSGTQKVVATKNKYLMGKKVAEIEVAEESRFTQNGTGSEKSDVETDDATDEGAPSIMLDKVLDLLSKRWDRMNGAQALRLLPKETKLKNLLPFLEPLLRKSSESCRNLSVIKNLRESENIQVKNELYGLRKGVVKITGDSMCSLCRKKIGTSVFAVYPNGKTIVHFVCFKDSHRPI